MKQEKLSIGKTPAIIYGDPSDKVYLFVHGQNGRKEEAGQFAPLVMEKGWQVLGIDLPGHSERKDESDAFLPWVIVPQLQQIRGYMESRWKRIALRANSIGAWFCMLAFGDKEHVNCLLVSPIVDMENLIRRMMGWAGVNEELLKAKQIIPTSFGQTLSWEYFQYAKTHPVMFCPGKTSILYGSGDDLTQRDIIDKFVERFNCDLTVIENGEHWFHTDEHMAVLNNWVQLCTAERED